MPNIIFHPDVEHEVKASYEWYQRQAVGLGDDFLSESLNQHIKQLLSFRLRGQNSKKIFGGFYLASFLSR
jgi:hypothetical protein